MENNYNDSPQLDVGISLNRFMAKVFGWMFVGLLSTAIIAFTLIFAMATNAAVLNFVSQHSSMIFILFIAEVALVWYLSARINKLSAASARGLFIAYSSLNGLSIGLICLAYGGALAYKAFLVTAVAFGVMAVYGFITNNDLTKLRSLLMMGVIGLIVMSLVNMITRSSGLEWIICIVGIFIFLALTAHDTQKMKNMYYSISSMDEAAVSKVATMGALALYLDFINLFLYLLRLFGRRS